MYLTHSDAKDRGGAASLGEQQYSYQNLYVTGLIKQGGVLVSNIEDAIEFIKTVADEFDESIMSPEGRQANISSPHCPPVYVHIK